ncbi:MAG: OmpA family protein [Cyclobacteriaceae bacterium]
MYSISRILIFLAVFFLIPRIAFAQEQDREQSKLYMEQAQLIMEATQAMDDARDLMVTAANFDTTNISANFEAGHMHLQTIGKELAAQFFLRIYRQDPDYRFDLEYWIGRSYQYGLDFERAIDFYNRYRQKLTARPTYRGRDKVEMAEVERRIAECENGKRYVASPKNYSIVNLGSRVNSEFEDFAPVLDATENELVFTSRRRDGNLNENVADDNKPYEDIYTATKSGSDWQSAKNIGSKVNTVYHESALSLSPDGKTLFIYNDVNGGDIMFCTKQTDGTWSPPIPLPGIINSSYKETSVSITEDGNTLYFASDRPGGSGGFDIYSCTKDSKGAWSRTRNLGPTINTPLDDDSPFIDYDGKTLYFSSQGRDGMGGFDIYTSTLINAEANQWSEPENLGYPINTPDDDIFYVSTKDGDRGYYSSIREDGLGYSDIYLITAPDETKEPVVASNNNTPADTPNEDPVETPPTAPKPEPTLMPLKYTVTVVDAASKNPLDAKVRMASVGDNIVVGSSPQGSGVYAFNVTSPTAKEYQLSVEREGYVFQNFKVSLPGAKEQPQTQNRTIELKRVAVGVTSVLRNIYFDFDKATFRTESYSELNKLETMLKQNAGMRVEIAGHTDNFGDKKVNQRLSQKRADAVRNFLVSKGIDPRRITTVGYGEDRPLASNDDEEDGRELNRRVEFKILSK